MGGCIDTQTRKCKTGVPNAVLICGNLGATFSGASWGQNGHCLGEFGPLFLHVHNGCVGSSMIFRPSSVPRFSGVTSTPLQPG